MHGFLAVAVNDWDKNYWNEVLNSFDQDSIHGPNSHKDISYYISGEKLLNFLEIMSYLDLFRVFIYLLSIVKIDVT